MVELRLAALGLRKHLCILSNFQYVAIIGQTDWEKLEMLQRNTFKIWSLKVFKGKKHFSKIHSIWELTWKIVLRSNWIPSYLTLSCVWICWTPPYCARPNMHPNMHIWHIWPYLAYLGAYLGARNMVKWGVPEKILQNAVPTRWS